MCLFWLNRYNATKSMCLFLILCVFLCVFMCLYVSYVSFFRGGYLTNLSVLCIMSHRPMKGGYYIYGEEEAR